MNWFLVFSFVIGILLALIPKFITKNIKKAIESNRSERDFILESVNAWILFYVWIVIIAVGCISAKLVLTIDEEIEKLDTRIETLEQQTVTPAIDTLYIKDLLKNE